jgi:hypothetical protein
MLRVFKPSSPMSLGTWCLTIYAAPLTILTATSLWGNDTARSLHRIALLVGLVPALGAALYKGVLFSTSAQPVWKDARWLGGHLANSSFLLGSTTLLAMAILWGHDNAKQVLRVATALLLIAQLVILCLMATNVRTPVLQSRGAVNYWIALAVGGGVIAPLALLLFSGTTPTLIAAALILFVAQVIRMEIVRWPHRIELTRHRE